MKLLGFNEREYIVFFGVFGTFIMILDYKLKG
jgi:hypothetical protein